MMDLTKLNPEQRRIVETTNGKQLILAGAGAGKTMVLSYKTAWLIDQGLAQGNEILAVTFTNKAAAELKERISKQLDRPVGRWWIGTFHGLCVRMLLAHGEAIGVQKNFTIADEGEQKKLVAELIKKRGVDLEAKEVVNAISRIKTSLKAVEDHQEGPFRPMFPDLIDLYNEYHAKLQAMNALDFDDLIIKVLRMLEGAPTVKEILANQFKYILVDESQDLDFVQYRLLEELASIHGNLTLVGDLDQSIYGFRGAQPEIVRLYAGREDVLTMKLEQNYRCSKNVIEAANAVVSRNVERLDKTLWTQNANGEPIIRYEANNEFQEAEFISGVVQFLCNRLGKAEYRDFAILCRRNTQIRPIEDALSKNMIRYRILGGNSFYERKEVMDTLAYLRMLTNPFDLLAFNRVANEPKRGAGPAALSAFSDFMLSNELSIPQALARCNEIKLTKKTKEAFLALGQTIDAATLALEDTPPFKVIRDYMVATGYLDMLDATGETDRVENVYQISELAKVFHEEEGQGRPFKEITLDFLRQTALMSATDEDDAMGNNAVTILTAHAAKGLEYPNVIISGLEEGGFPSYYAIQEGDSAVEEERRLFYVALTRAKSRLYLTHCKQRTSFGREPQTCRPSRFLQEIPSRLVKSVQ